MNNNKVVNLHGFPINEKRKVLIDAINEPKTKMGELMKLADAARIAIVAVFE